MLLRISALLLAHVYVATAWNTFVVPHTDGQDDTPILTAALANYTTNSTILFQKGVTYNILTPIKFPVFTNVEVRIEGNLTYPTDIATIQAIVGKSVLGFPRCMVRILVACFGKQELTDIARFTFSGGNNVTLRGSTDPNWGWVDAHGQTWWNAQNQVNRPHGFGFSKITNGVIRDMKLWKPIAWNFATSGSSNIHAFNNRIVAVSENPDKVKSFSPRPSPSTRKWLAFSLVLIRAKRSHYLRCWYSDGFSAGGTNMLFENNHIQNGDDCLTVGNGAKNIHFRNSYCEGGHGLSIGSLGKGGQVADVQNILIENVVMKNSLYGARFKSWTGGNGLARNVTWKNIGLDNVRFPIYITQNYWDQGVGPKPNTTTMNNTHIQDFTFQGFTGLINDSPDFFEGSCVSDPCWYAVPGATGHEVAIFDLYPSTAINIVAKNIFPVTKTKSPATVMCDPSTISTDVGFKCWDGKFIRTKADKFKVMHATRAKRRGHHRGCVKK
ncbi:putative glycosyl hydrolase 28 family protein [Lyophyllum shimeji]|uniref:galacturonan 1,4-alpha-galacturonidase n=1 Tax=Lyophyllum shimeji TaxID=47721 RepID=A0A9P3UV17_LYOSH|nr:putative glycosyl hydrolase 28 family protein [Lyophyllum shimeji]